MSFIFYLDNFNKAWHTKVDYVNSTTENEERSNRLKKKKIIFDSESDVEGK